MPLLLVKDIILSNMSSSAPIGVTSTSAQLRRMGVRVRLARVQQSLSSDELSSLAGISRPTLRNLENGHAGVSVGAFFRVLNVLGLGGLVEVGAQQTLPNQPGDEGTPSRRRRSRKRLTQASSPARGRPRTLAEVANCARSFGGIDMFVREFLDEFYGERDPIRKNLMLYPEPPLSDNARENAYLAAVAEHLALRNMMSVPSWVNSPTRFLRSPYFPAGLESLKAICVVESPSAFRRRLIFVDADPLSRPRRESAPHESVEA